MKITESRANDILHWLDDMAGDHTVLFEAMTAHRDTAALIRQLQAELQDAWHAGLDAGREQVRSNRLADEAKDAEIEALRVEVAAQRTRADAMAGEAIKHEARAERLEEALLEARDRMLGQVKWVACDCGCERNKPADAVSVAWFRASALLRDQEEGNRIGST